MKFAMFSLGKEQEIFYSIVFCIFVYMMNIISFGYWMTKSLLHHYTMFSPILPFANSY